MYLTRMELDLTKRKTLLALSARSLLHGAVETAFPGERRRKLWRLDSLGGREYLLLLSEDIPDLKNAQEQFGKDSAAWETKDYTPLLERTVKGSRWHFRLAANPTYQLSRGKGKRGRLCAHTTAAHQREWLKEQSEKHGFRLEEENFDVISNTWHHFGKGSGHRQVSLLLATYEGILEITDETLFRGVLTNGIGRGKAYGAGLMTLVRPRD